MAAPHVSGVAALIWSYYPTQTEKEIWNALAESVHFGSRRPWTRRQVWIWNSASRRSVEPSWRYTCNTFTKQDINTVAVEVSHQITNAFAEKPPPTKEPTNGTMSPTKAPTMSPTKVPTMVPSKSPSKEPTHLPSALPLPLPTNLPTALPSKTPIHFPSSIPTVLTTSPSTKSSQSPSSESCFDSPNWQDSFGAQFNCEFYESNDECNLYGNSFRGLYNKTANEACCFCGGGQSDPSLTISPTISPTNSPTNSKTSVVSTLSPVSGCANNPQDWHDALLSPIYNCQYYEDNNDCATYGDMFPDISNKTANEACCFCGGGTYSSNAPSGSPSGKPSSAHISLPTSNMKFSESPSQSARKAPSDPSSLPTL